MKICVLFLTLCMLYCNGFIFDSCSSDTDCTNGCCKASGSLLVGKHCVHYIGLHGNCHLSGMDSSHCGCGPNLHCIDHIEGSQIAIEGNLRPGYGFCEQGNGTSTGSGGMIATEG